MLCALDASSRQIRMTFLSDIATIPVPGAPLIAMARCRYDATAYDDDLYDALGVPLADCVRNAVGKRKAEYLAGRYLAGLLLERHALPTHLASGAHRQPLWPEGWTGSITHTRDAAVVALGHASQVAALGIDLEPWISDGLAGDIHASIIDREEAAALDAWPFSEALTLAFSAKESVFKALYPNVGRHFDFSAARITALDTRRSVLSVEIRQPLSARVMPGLRLEARYCRGSQGVFTAVADGIGDLPMAEATMAVLS